VSNAILLEETKVMRDGRMEYFSACLDLKRRDVLPSSCSRSISSASFHNPSDKKRLSDLTGVRP
jgi:hypothetical protein